jgi:Flp pilus assembly protein TadD
LGIHLYRAGKFNEAEAAFPKALELAPTRPGSQGRIGLIYLIRSQSVKALAEIQKEPNAVWRQQGLAIYYHATGNKKEADSTSNE